MPEGGRGAAPPARETISACLIVLNEAERLPACLDSVAFCDEIVVVDSGSTDDTVAIAEAHGARVVVNPWPGFGAQRNVAIDHASCDWILEVDADERITPELARELQAFLADPGGHDVGVLPMRDWFLGRLLGPAVKYPRYRTRLLRRGVYRHDERRAVHEGIWPQGRTWVARGDMHHLLASSMREALTDWWRYAQLEASRAAPLAGGAALLKGVVVRPFAKLGYRVVVDGGWKDGGRGLLRIGLDVASDVIVGLRRARRRDRPPEADAGHLGRQGAIGGPVRIVGVATGHAQSARLAAWLSEAAAAGADAALVADVPPPPGGPVQFVPLTRRGPIAALRAIDVAVQVRPVDAWVLPPGLVARLFRLVPADLRGPLVPLRLDADAATAVADVTRASRALEQTARLSATATGTSASS